MAAGWLGLLMLSAPVTEAFDSQHQRLARLLARHVTEGAVDYSDLVAEAAELRSYLGELSAVSRGQFEEWPAADQLAFLVNFYNAATLQLVVDHYPVASIRRIGGWWKGPWSLPVVDLFGRRRTLEQLEHEVIRRRFHEPRLTFTLVTATRSSPPLRAEPYVGERWHQQVEDQARLVLSDPRWTRWEPSSNTLWLTSALERGASDFAADGGSLVEYVLPRHPAVDGGPGARDVKLRFLPPDWAINASGAAAER